MLRAIQSGAPNIGRTVPRYLHEQPCDRPDTAGLADASQGLLDTTRNMKIKTSISHRILSACVTIGLVALFLCVVNGCAANKNAQQSASAESRTKDSFDLADANHDGKLSREEAGDYLVYVVFLFRDKNQDGRLTQEEWAAGDRNQIAAFKLRDANEDGAVTMEEAIVFGRRGGGAVALMRRADKNRDGKLDRAELEAYGHQP